MVVESDPTHMSPEYVEPKIKLTKKWRIKNYGNFINYFDSIKSK